MDMPSWARLAFPRRDLPRPLLLRAARAAGSGSVGREFRPSQTAAGRAQVSRSVGSPESGRAVWAAEREGRSVGHPVSRLSGRGGAVGRKFYPNFIKKESILFSRCPLESDTTLMQKAITRTAEFGARSRLVLKQNRGEPWRRLQLGRSVGRAESGRTAAPPAGRVGRSGRPDPKFASPRCARRSVGRGVPSRKRYLRLLVSRSGITGS